MSARLADLSVQTWHKGTAARERRPTRLSKAMHSAMYAWYGLLVLISSLYGDAATMEETTSASPIHSLNPSARRDGDAA